MGDGFVTSHSSIPFTSPIHYRINRYISWSHSNMEAQYSRMLMHEAKGMPQAIEQSKIVSGKLSSMHSYYIASMLQHPSPEHLSHGYTDRYLTADIVFIAYGLRKCPKLVEQLAASSPLDVRVNALVVLCDELNNPYSVYSCADAGVVVVLSKMISDTDFSTRLYASKALAIMAKVDLLLHPPLALRHHVTNLLYLQDANGLDAILHEDAIPNILLGGSDPSEDVRLNIFECLLHVTRTADGVDACNAANVTKCFVDAIRLESDNIRTILLPALYNIVGSDVGLVDALACNAVKVCVQLLTSSNPKVIAAAARTLGFICFDERGKKDALDAHAIQTLTNVILVNKLSMSNLNLSPKKTSSSSDASITASTTSSLLMALASITSTDEGKRQCNGDGVVEGLIQLLDENDRLIKLNVLKVMSNIAVYPPIRSKLLGKDYHCLSKLQAIMQIDDKLLKRHAEIAMNATTWKP
jgi:hypothetical protein